MAQLVGVHGIGHDQSGRHQLLTGWTAAVADGLERALGAPVPAPELDIAFYGDLFLPDQSSLAKAADTVPEDLSTEELHDLLDLAGEAVTEAELARARRETEKGYTRTPLPLQAALRALDLRFGAAAGVLCMGVLRQVHRYLRDPDLKDRVDRRVAKTISPGCRAVIGHSLGSVVAYEYLRQNPDHRVDLFLTVGSPLGLRMVRSGLSVDPVGSTEWVNLRDPRDPVTCAGDLSVWWPQLTDSTVDNGGAAHDAGRYLGKRRAGEAIISVLPELGR